MSEGRQQHTATLLRDGRVFIAGGYWSDGPKWRVLSSTEIYDPRTGNYSPTGSMGTSRDSATPRRSWTMAESSSPAVRTSAAAAASASRQR